MVELLERSGHTVLAPDLPGHGDDTTPLDEIESDAYRARIREVLGNSAEPVILVGHSMGGIVISLGAEECPEKVAKLIYLAAFLPNPDQPDGDLKAGPEIAAAMNVEPNGLAIKFDPSATRDVFYADCSDEDIALANRKICLQPLAPMREPTNLSAERFGSVPRQYVECTLDRALPIETQRRLHAASPCEKVHTLETSHSPFFSQPETLCKILEEVAENLKGR